MSSSDGSRRRSATRCMGGPRRVRATDDDIQEKAFGPSGLPEQEHGSAEAAKATVNVAAEPSGKTATPRQADEPAGLTGALLAAFWRRGSAHGPTRR